MSDRYITLRSFAVIIMSRRMGGHLSRVVSLVVPFLFQRPCRTDPEGSSSVPTTASARDPRYSRTMNVCRQFVTSSASRRGITGCRVAATSLLACVALCGQPAAAQSRPETPNEGPEREPAQAEPASPSEPGSLLEPINRDGSGGAAPSTGARTLRDANPAEPIDGPAASPASVSIEQVPIDQAFIESLPEVTFAQTLEAFGVVRT